MRVHAVARFLAERGNVTSREVADEFEITIGAALKALIHCETLGWAKRLLGRKRNRRGSLVCVWVPGDAQ